MWSVLKPIHYIICEPNRHEIGTILNGLVCKADTSTVAFSFPRTSTDRWLQHTLFPFDFQRSIFWVKEVMLLLTFHLF